MKILSDILCDPKDNYFYYLGITSGNVRGVIKSSIQLQLGKNLLKKQMEFTTFECLCEFTFRIREEYLKHLNGDHRQLREIHKTQAVTDFINSKKHYYEQVSYYYVKEFVFGDFLEDESQII